MSSLEAVTPKPSSLQDMELLEDEEDRRRMEEADDDLFDDKRAKARGQNNPWGRRRR